MQLREWSILIAQMEDGFFYKKYLCLSYEGIRLDLG